MKRFSISTSYITLEKKKDLEKPEKSRNDSLKEISERDSIDIQHHDVWNTTDTYGKYSEEDVVADLIWPRTQDDVAVDQPEGLYESLFPEYDDPSDPYSLIHLRNLSEENMVQVS